MSPKKIKALHRRLCLCLCIVISAVISCACAVQSSPAALDPTDPPMQTQEPMKTDEPVATCELPDLQYETEAYALSALSAHGAFAVVEYEETAKLPAGLVTSQSVAAGVCAAKGEPVTIVVSKAISPTPTPVPTKEPVKKTASPAESETASAVIEAPITSVNPEFPTVTPQPTRDPSTLDFFISQPDQRAESCG